MSQTARQLIIVGSGPAGYTAAIYAARADLRPLVLTGSIEAGGALMNTTDVENFPGFPDGIMGPELMTKLQEQATRFGAELLAEDAVQMRLDAEIKTVTDESGNTHSAPAVILAMGSGYRRLGLPGEDRLSGRGVSWCATCDGFFFRDKAIAVVGGGDSAMEEATFLSRFAKSVTLVHRRSKFRASKIMLDRALADPKINFVTDSAVTSIDGESSLQAIQLSNTVTGQAQELGVQGLFIAIGHDPRSQLVQGQVDLDAEGYVLTQAGSTQTNLSGVFACGDLVDHTYRQAITAAGSGCAAALDAERYLAQLPALAAASA